MKTTTLAASSKGQTLMPLDWRKGNDLTGGDSCNAFYLEDGALLIVPVRPPGKGPNAANSVRRTAPLDNLDAAATFARKPRAIPGPDTLGCQSQLTKPCKTAIFRS